MCRISVKNKRKIEDVYFSFYMHQNERFQHLMFDWIRLLNSTQFGQNDAEKNAADVKNLQQYLMLLIGQRVIGFNEMKKGIQVESETRKAKSKNLNQCAMPK